MREANSDAGVEETYHSKVEKLKAEVNDLWTLLQEAREIEAKAMEEVQAKEKEQQDIIDNLEEKCQRAEESCEGCLRPEEKCVRLEHDLTRAELDHYRRLETERHKCEGREERLLNELQKIRRLTSELWDLSRDHVHRRRKTSEVDAMAVPEVSETNKVPTGVEVSNPVSLAPADSSLHQRTSSLRVTQPCPDDT